MRSARGSTPASSGQGDAPRGRRPSRDGESRCGLTSRLTRAGVIDRLGKDWEISLADGYMIALGRLKQGEPDDAS